MKNIIKKEKGITMVALVITIIILLILTNVLIYNAQDMIYVRSLTNLYNDIQVLREKVIEYYNEYGDIPAKIEYTNVSNLNSVLSKNNDTGKFYVIDLEAMKGITLNFGKDYEKVKNDAANANNYTDLYVINENSHNIFYIAGVTIKEEGVRKTYYTDYTEPDETTTDLKYIDGILIPEGYYYIGKNAEGAIVISTNKNEEINNSSSTQYVWQKQLSEIDKKPDSVKLSSEQTEADFIKSVNAYKGYFRNIKTNNVVYLKIDEELWSEPFTKESTYTDAEGNTARIPEGFRVSLAATMNSIKKGLVAKDKNNNEWVWIEVPKTIFTTADNGADFDNIKADLIEYAKDYRKGSSSQNLNANDEWYEGCGLTKEEYENNYNRMLTSIYNNNGFWIGRYEVGDSVATTNNITRTKNSGCTNKAVIQPNQIPYNFVTVAQAQELSESLATGGKTSNLMFGIQWDLVCKFLERNTSLRYYDIATDSTNWGNYSNSSILLSRGKYNINPGITSSTWVTYSTNTNNYVTSSKTNNNENYSQLLTTGASEYTRIMNIYDFAGNTWELTLEFTNIENYFCVTRGGAFTTLGNKNSISYIGTTDINSSVNNVSFRPALY